MFICEPSKTTPDDAHNSKDCQDLKLKIRHHKIKNGLFIDLAYFSMMVHSSKNVLMFKTELISSDFDHSGI